MPEVEHDRQGRVGAASDRASRGRSPTAAPARCPAYGPTAASSPRWARVAADDERPALLVLGAVGAPPGVEDALDDGRRPAAGRRTGGRLGATRSHPRPDPRSGIGAHQPRPGSSAPASDSRAGTPRRAGQRDLHQGPQAARIGVDGREAVLQRRHRCGGSRGRDRRGLVGRQRPAERRGKEAGDRGAVGRDLVQPRVLAVRRRQGLDRSGVARRRPARDARPRPGAPGGWPARRRRRRRGRAGSARGSARWRVVALTSRTRGRAARGRRAWSARRADRRSGRGWAGGRGGTSGGSAGSGSAGAGGRDDRRDALVGGAGQDRPDRAHRVADDRAAGDLGPGEQGVERGQRVEPELAGADGQRLGRVRAVAADVDGQAVEAGGVQEDRVGQRPVAGRLPAVDQRDARTGRAVAGRDEPGRQVEVARADEPSSRTAGRGPPA